MDILMDTVRKEIADCAEKAYKQLKVSDAQKLLFLDHPNAVSLYASQRKWNVVGNVIEFNRSANVSGNYADNANEVIARTLSYAKELERII